jgi:uncharacterized protein (TIGR02001 family)
LRLVGVFAVAVAFHPCARAGEFSGIATLTSQYIYRGFASSDGDPAVQAGLDYEADSGLFVGAWASTIDLPSPGGSRDLELDYYAGYHYAPDKPVSASFSLARYSYPGSSADRSYDYTEALVSLALRNRYSIEFGYSNDVYGRDAIGRHVELRADWPLESAWVIDAGAGLNDLEDLGASRFAYWDVGASARFSRLTLDLRWYDNQTPDGYLAYQSAGSQFVVSLSASF